ncbi:SDR family oxidoreductase [Clostridium beijerinckii]|uniref:3-oxoacyl-[acyl-carrier protein] reductase n=1 Tax=Clostridium beijerinckii TaxID=1520 RepID=A0A9Q5CSK2_CLOBE|nr:SDR family oxidoreductase [Clostridium beijerinckii]AQS06719.1 3-oxoacyl-[acyl-carrier-protein] reductase FabG [Clostridium beijerinckii]MBA2887664.1 3-oxoacyl-[acyl-carrier protein] reductase [Clostridium beijerinckii]MBA2901628.1 3-oxoacyl-[acyl-carrier protein] reductase [Clostridium beijerinckii]MBA2911485.1 3-oxoacyl-[acyl-carrier protein] reductase [Clostridium beijerinckii]MBA9013652.1 3-oxoacyl-[acyl-carrier protein] reductase [Clostridium beijerinckii]
MRNLEGKVAIITGASRGIGSAIARQLSALGAKVVVNYSNNAVKAEEVVEEITKSGEQAVAIKADVSNIKDVERLFSETITKFGKVDILVNNAGVILYKLLSDVTEEEFDNLFNINVKGTYFACQQAMKHMEDNGRIINFSTSVVGSMFPTYSVYAATKGAVEQITRQLAKEFGPKKITINAVAPGPINTELFNVGKTDEQIEAIRQMNSFGRIGEPDDIANAIEFLVSDKAQWITGQTLRINGGYV